MRAAPRVRLLDRHTGQSGSEPLPAGRRGQASRIFLVAGAALTVAATTVPGGVPQAASHVALNAAATTAVLVGIGRHRPARPLGWWLLAAALAVYTVGNVSWAASAAGRGEAWASPVDFVAKLLAIVLIGGAVAAFLHEGRFRYDRRPLFNGALVGVSAVVLLGQLVLLVGEPAASAEITAGSAALFALSVALLAVALRLLGTAGRTASTVALVLAAALALLGQALVAASGGAAPRWVDATWLLATTLIGTAALHPSINEVRVTETAPALLIPTRFKILAGALLLGPFVLWLTVMADARATVLLTVQVMTLGAVTVLGIGSSDEVDPEDDGPPLPL